MPLIDSLHKILKDTVLIELSYSTDNHVVPNIIIVIIICLALYPSMFRYLLFQHVHNEQNSALYIIFIIT